jgi:CHAD domain-containing protein
MRRVPTSMHAYAMRQVSGLLETTIKELRNTARARDAEAIHELRVSIRRLLQALKTFAQYLPKEARERFRDELHSVIKASGGVRDCDVLIEMLADSGVALDTFHQQRTELKKELLATIEPLLDGDLSGRWRTDLGIRRNETTLER